ncbi:DUF3397 domain-containing protein [Virgibacillus ihumii]|uniref:DUF3397 domain-containing protein n=1 Tax=Virgibacillus ihumii TaxID=2686091 RepID=UPI00157D38A3|nr:DUF3397 domain-containing protein [Virgibacillus ihumii]
MLNIIVYVIGLMITVPVAVTLIVYVIGVKVYRQKWKAIHKAVSWTTLLYIIAVLVMLQQIFDSSFIGIWVIVLLSIFTVIAVVHWKLYTEVVFYKVFKIFWRVCFLLFVLLYIVLVVIGIMQQLLS